jgi:NAD(P)-dependent dehydrogenase (short-subunit alcohol dehydrogenase family)
MARIFITGSADGLGQLAAVQLIKTGHQVVLHARSEERAKQALGKIAGAEDVVIGDLSDMNATKALATKVNASGTFDAIIHNAGVYQVPPDKLSIDGLPLLLAVNTIAPYILTCLIKKPKRLIYLSSGMHLQGSPKLQALSQTENIAKSNITYSDTKLHDVILSMAVAGKFTSVISNAIDPGWVPTKMGGAGAPDSLAKGYETQVWLAVSDEPGAILSGRYLHHKKEDNVLPVVYDLETQAKFLAICEQITGVQLTD